MNGLSDLQALMFSRSPYQKERRPHELLGFYAFIEKKNAMDYNKGVHPFMLQLYSLQSLYLESQTLVPNIHKIIIQQDLLEGVNFNRLCEFRSKSFFKAHSINNTIKRKPNGQRSYGLRIKYLRFLNAEIAIACHLKKIICAESSCVEVVYKLIARVQTLQLFVHQH